MAVPSINPGDNKLPGISTRRDMIARTFLLNDNHVMEKGVIIDDVTQDIGNTPVTQLRPGLALVRVEAAGVNQGKYVHATHADAPAAANILNAVILSVAVNMLDEDAVLVDKGAKGVIHGHVDQDQVIFGVGAGAVLDAIVAALNLVNFEDSLP